MDLPPALLQFGGSLIAILAIFWLVRRLGLGPAPLLESDEAASHAAECAVAGFRPVAIARDSGGQGALLRDAAGRVLLLRQHGAHFAGRMLGPLAQAHIDDDALIVDSAERRYGAVRLTIDDASAWVEAIGALKEGRHA